MNRRHGRPLHPAMDLIDMDADMMPRVRRPSSELITTIIHLPGEANHLRETGGRRHLIIVAQLVVIPLRPCPAAGCGRILRRILATFPLCPTLVQEATHRIALGHLLLPKQ